MLNSKKFKSFKSFLYPWLALAILVFLIPILAVSGVDVSLKWCVASVLAFFLFDSLGVQIGVHKLMSHQSFETSDLIRKILAFLSVFSGQGSPITWVAVHMSSHHPFYDTEKDAHSPNDGRFYSFISWYWKVDIKKINYGAARKYIRDPFLVFLHKNHSLVLFFYWIALLSLGREFLLYLGLLPAFFSIALVGVVNCFMHYEGKLSKVLLWKYQNHKGDQTYNSILLGFCTMGLGLHNNHHYSQASCYNDEKWYELDLSRFIIPLLKRNKEL